MQDGIFRGVVLSRACRNKDGEDSGPYPMVTHRSLRRRIVLPFIVLVVFVGFIGTAVVSAQVGGSAAGAFDNSLVRSSLRTNDRVASLENDRLQQLRAAADTAGIATATGRNDGDAAGRLLGPIVGNAQPQHLVLRVLTTGGRELVALRRSGATVETFSGGASYTGQAAVQHALAGARDSLGDKHIFLSNETPTMLYWVAPIWTNAQPPTVVGAVLLGEALPEIVQIIPGSSSNVVAFFDPFGQVLAGWPSGIQSLSPRG